MTFTTIIVSSFEHLKANKMKVIKKPKDSNSKCKCGKILLDGRPAEDVGLVGRDSLGRSKVICLDCRNKHVK